MRFRPGSEENSGAAEAPGSGAATAGSARNGDAGRNAGPDLVHRRLAVLNAAAERLGTTLDVGITCAELAEFAVPAMADLAVVEILPPEGADRTAAVPAGSVRLRRAALARTDEGRPRLAEPASPSREVTYPERSVIAHCLRSGVAVVCDTDTADSPLSAAGFGALLAVPLTAHGRAVGVLTLARAKDRPASAFTPDDVVLADDLATRAGVAIDNARHFTQSQGVALQLQRALLTEPGKPHPNLEAAFRYLPSGTASVVGGDWYEIVRLSFGRTLLVMGDVMGHGVEAAVDMSNYRSTLRYVAATDLPPHRILRRLDALIDQEESARPATCLVVLADPNRKRWTFSSAGHLPPALIAAGRPIELADIPAGPPLGTGLGGYEQATRDMDPGETLLLYTDGLIERRDQDIDESLARLTALRLPTAGGLDELLDAVLRDLTPHTAEDDIALLAARASAR